MTILFSNYIIFFSFGLVLLSFINIHNNIAFINLTIYMSIIISFFISIFLSYFYLLDNIYPFISVSIYFILLNILLIVNKNNDIFLVEKKFYYGLFVVILFSIVFWYYIVNNTIIGLLPSQDIYDYILRMRFFIDQKGSNTFFGPDFYPYSISLFQTYIYKIWHTDIITTFIYMPLLFLSLSCISVYLFVYSSTKNTFTSIYSAILLIAINGYGYIHVGIHPYNSTFCFILANIIYSIFKIKIDNKLLFYFILFIGIISIFIIFPYSSVVVLYILSIYFINSYDFKEFLKINNKKSLVLTIIFSVLYLIGLFFGNIILNKASSNIIIDYSLFDKVNIIIESYGYIIIFFTITGLIYSYIKKIHYLEIIYASFIFISILLPLPRVHRLEEFERIFILLFTGISFITLHNYFFKKIVKKYGENYDKN
jgi:hypothetical protein